MGKRSGPSGTIDEDIILAAHVVLETPKTEYRRANGFERGLHCRRARAGAQGEAREAWVPETFSYYSLYCEQESRLIIEMRFLRQPFQAPEISDDSNNGAKTER